MQTSNNFTAKNLTAAIASLPAATQKELKALSNKALLSIINQPAQLATQYNKPAQKALHTALTALIAAAAAIAPQQPAAAPAAPASQPAAQLITAISQLTANCCYKSSAKAKCTYKLLQITSSGQLIIQHISAAYPAASTAANTFAYTPAAAANILKYATAAPASPAPIYSPTAASLAAQTAAPASPAPASPAPANS